MKKLIIYPLLFMANFSAFAGVRTIYNHNNLRSELYDSKTDAYNSGHDISDSLSKMTEQQLYHRLSLDGHRHIQSVVVDATIVSVKELSKHRGEIEYQAIVDVAYHYKANEHD